MAHNIENDFRARTRWRQHQSANALAGLTSTRSNCYSTIMEPINLPFRWQMIRSLALMQIAHLTRQNHRTTLNENDFLKSELSKLSLLAKYFRQWMANSADGQIGQLPPARIINGHCRRDAFSIGSSNPADQQTTDRFVIESMHTAHVLHVQFLKQT